ncbi:MAG: SIR2 family protein [Nitrospirae bacterium]|nr:SIR2 family protein [Nitrospirota bacterium]
MFEGYIVELNDYLFDNPFNIKNLDLLKSEFGKNPSLFVPFIGAGPSKVLGASDWYYLLKDLYKSFSLKTTLPMGKNRIKYHKRFSDLYKKLDEEKRKHFFENIFKFIRATQTNYTAFHIELVKLFQAFITTNYDSPIEKAFIEKKNKSLSKYYFTHSDISKLKDGIIYLHGHEDTGFVIIRTEEYNYFYPSVHNKKGISILEDFLIELFKTMNVIFIGFSFDDLYIKNFIHYIYVNVVKDSPESFKQYHFWLIDETVKAFDETKQKAKIHTENGRTTEAESEYSKFFTGNLNIRPIVYKKDQHIFVENLFKTLYKPQPEPMTVYDPSN